MTQALQTFWAVQQDHCDCASSERDPRKPEGKTGFTPEGDPVFNDPANKTTPIVYKRADFLAAWEYSHRTVYLVYPKGAAIPESAAGRWRPREK